MKRALAALLLLAGCASTGGRVDEIRVPVRVDMQGSPHMRTVSLHVQCVDQGRRQVFRQLRDGQVLGIPYCHGKVALGIEIGHERRLQWAEEWAIYPDQRYVLYVRRPALHSSFMHVSR